MKLQYKTDGGEKPIYKHVAGIFTEDAVEALSFVDGNHPSPGVDMKDKVA